MAATVREHHHQHQHQLENLGPIVPSSDLIHSHDSSTTLIIDHDIRLSPEGAGTASSSSSNNNNNNNINEQEKGHELVEKMPFGGNTMATTIPQSSIAAAATTTTPKHLLSSNTAIVQSQGIQNVPVHPFGEDTATKQQGDNLILIPSTTTTTPTTTVINNHNNNNNNINVNNNMSKPAGSVTNAIITTNKPLGLHQSINIDHNRLHNNNNNNNQLIAIDQCLAELVDDIKSPIAARGPTFEAESAASECQQAAAGSKQVIDIPIRLEAISEFYDLEARPFARGKFAQVKRCTKKDSKGVFAAKCIKKRRRLVDIRHEILLEIEALKLSYYTEHIVKLYEIYETPAEMILVLEMANGGELQRVLDDEETGIDERIVQRMVRQILEGLIYLHDNHIAHLDIKPQNLLLTEPFPNGNVKLCDFGISRRITKDCEIREICGTPDYVAPEILRYDPISLATDMWSLGVLTYVLLSGYSPFGSENKQQTFCNITQASLDFPSDIFANISEDAKDFVRKLIVREPSGRLTSRQARQHHWLGRC